MAMLVKVLPLQEAEETRQRNSGGMIDLSFGVQKPSP